MNNETSADRTFQTQFNRKTWVRNSSFSSQTKYLGALNFTAALYAHRHDQISHHFDFHISTDGLIQVYLIGPSTFRQSRGGNSTVQNPRLRAKGRNFCLKSRSFNFTFCEAIANVGMITPLKNLPSSQASFISVPSSGFGHDFLELAHPLAYSAILKRTFGDRVRMGQLC
jgi:hypothetical protein